MAERTLQILPGGQSAAPFTYTVPGSTAFRLRAVRAVFDGSGAASAFKPCVQIKSNAGVVMAETIGDSVNAGGSADASFFPRVRRAATATTDLTYYQVIAALAVTSSLVGQWHLTEGAVPYADTSGSSVGGNAQLVLQNFGGGLTQNNPDGPLASAPAGPSVDYTSGGTGLSDYLHTSLAPLGRFTFSGNAVFTVVAWIKPRSSANTRYSGVVGDVIGFPSGAPNEHADGWQIAVKGSTLECVVQRFANVPVGGSCDTVSLGAMSTTQWTMVGMTYDGSTLRGYANGALVGSTASAGAIGNAQDVLVGLSQFGSSAPPIANAWFLGEVAEITVWASTLTAADLALLYTSSLN